LIGENGKETNTCSYMPMPPPPGELNSRGGIAFVGAVSGLEE